MEEKLKQIIINNYGSVRAFAKKVDIPYTTMDTILKRGVMKANVLNIIKICKKLDIDIESLANGKIKTKEK